MEKSIARDLLSEDQAKEVLSVIETLPKEINLLIKLTRNNLKRV